MAETGAEMDYPAHERSYANFVSLFKWGAVAFFVTAGIVILIISR